MNTRANAHENARNNSADNSESTAATPATAPAATAAAAAATPSEAERQVARWLGYLGLLPFLAAVLSLAIGTLDGDDDLVDIAARALIAYAAVVVSFLGAVHWGLAMAAPDVPRRGFRFVLSAVPSLLAWFALLIPERPAVLLLLACIIGVWRAESRLDISLIDWYATLRTQLTIGAALFLACAAIVL